MFARCYVARRFDFKPDCGLCGLCALILIGQYDSESAGKQNLLSSTVLSWTPEKRNAAIWLQMVGKNAELICSSADFSIQNLRERILRFFSI